MDWTCALGLDVLERVDDGQGGRAMRFQVMYEQDGEWYEAIGESLTAEEVADALPDLIEAFGCVKVRESYE